MIAVLVGCLLFVKYERPSKSKDYYFDKDDHDKIFPRVAILAMVCIVMHACEFSSYCVFYRLTLGCSIIHSCCDVIISWYCSRCSDP